MKKVFCFLALFYAIVFFGQNGTVKLPGSQSAQINFSAINNLQSVDYFTVNFHKYQDAQYFFSVINATTSLNDIYYLGSGNKMNYSKSVFIPENFMRGVKIDSFSPNGCNDLAGAIVLGVLNTVFSKTLVIK